MVKKDNKKKTREQMKDGKKIRSQKERMLAQELYLASDPELRRDALNGRRLLRLINQTDETQLDDRKQLVKELLGASGENIYIEPPFFCDYGKNIAIGENFYANTDCIFLDVACISIGHNVMFGPRVCLYTPGHPIDAVVRTSGPEFGKEISIGDNVWLGGDVIVNPGVTIGDNTIVGSGSVVTKDLPSHVIAAGNPCRVIRGITDEDQRYWEEQQAIFQQDCQI